MSNSTNKLRNAFGATGNINNSLVAGGDVESREFSELYNGITWNLSENLNQPRYGNSAAGVPNNTITAGGHISYETTPFNSTEVFNGINWSY